ncbi:MAG: shikimate kinase [Prevotella sp.]|nr:shikimate kinase [Prevotella sp.]
MKRIILIGYMGAGKTTVGRALAKRLGLQFYDLDWYIESRRMQKIPQIFALKGEQGFRQIERSMLHEVAEFEDIVLSCGGGTPCFFDNMDYLNAQGQTVYLQCSTDVLCQHLRMGHTERPLLKGKSEAELLDFVERQVAERQTYYLRARHVFDVTLMDNYEKIQLTVDGILKELSLGQQDKARQV